MVFGLKFILTNKDIIGKGMQPKRSRMVTVLAQ